MLGVVGKLAKSIVQLYKRNPKKICFSFLSCPNSKYPKFDFGKKFKINIRALNKILLF